MGGSGGKQMFSHLLGVPPHLLPAGGCCGWIRQNSFSLQLPAGCGGCVLQWSLYLLILLSEILIIFLKICLKPYYSSCRVTHECFSSWFITGAACCIDDTLLKLLLQVKWSRMFLGSKPVSPMYLMKTCQPHLSAEMSSRSQKWRHSPECCEGTPLSAGSSKIWGRWKYWGLRKESSAFCKTGRMS